MNAALVWALMLFVSGCTPDDETNAPPPPLPCAVDAVLQHVCQTCHTAPPQPGVPIALVTYSDVHALYTQEPDYHDTPVYKVMGDVLREGIMPQAPVTLSSADRTVLLDWIDKGAPAAPTGTRCP